MKTRNARRKSVLMKLSDLCIKIKWLRCMSHLWHGNVHHKRSMNWRVFSLFHFPFFWAIPFSEREIIDNCNLPTLLVSRPLFPQTCCQETNCWMLSACACMPLALSMGPFIRTKPPWGGTRATNNLSSGKSDRGWETDALGAWENCRRKKKNQTKNFPSHT